MLTMEEYAYEAGLKATCEFWTLFMLVLFFMMIIGTALQDKGNKQKQVFCVIIAMVCIIVASFSYRMEGQCKGKMRYHDNLIQQQTQQQTQQKEVK